MSLDNLDPRNIQRIVKSALDTSGGNPQFLSQLTGLSETTVRRAAIDATRMNFGTRQKLFDSARHLLYSEQGHNLPNPHDRTLYPLEFALWNALYLSHRPAPSGFKLHVFGSPNRALRMHVFDYRSSHAHSDLGQSILRAYADGGEGDINSRSNWWPDSRVRELANAVGLLANIWGESLVW